MRFIPTRVHGVLDYAVALLLIAAPFLFGFANGGIAQWLPIILGLAVLGYSFLTDYEWGIVHTIPTSVHLLLDGAGGVLLAASPWLFGFSDEVYLPHLILGLFDIAASLTTRMASPARSRTLRD